MCRANAKVAGIPINAPSRTDHQEDTTGRPTQLPIRDAKNTFVAIAPAAKGYSTIAMVRVGQPRVVTVVLPTVLRRKELRLMRLMQ